MIWRALNGRLPRVARSRPCAPHCCLVAIASVLAACSPAPARSHAGAPDSSAIAQDSIAAAADRDYQTQLAKYRHDEAIIDSLTRVARQAPVLRGDSLYRVYRWALRPQGVSVADVNVMSCLHKALVLRYGIAASERVMKELQDTVFRDHGITEASRATEFYWSKAPTNGVMDSESCTRETNTHPDSIDGAPLDHEPSPPRLTRRMGSVTR